MNKKIIFSSLLICLLAFAAILACGQDSSNARWEYMTMHVDSNDRYKPENVISKMNKLGMEGCEYISGTIFENRIMFKRRLK